MKFKTIARIGVLLVLLAAVLGIDSQLAHVFNNPSVPGEATLSVIFFFIITLGAGSVFVTLIHDWFFKKDASPEE